MMLNYLSHLHLWEIVIPNYNTLRKKFPNHNTFWEIIIPKHNTFWENNPQLHQMTQVKPSSFDVGIKGICPSQPTLNLTIYNINRC